MYPPCMRVQFRPHREDDGCRLAEINRVTWVQDTWWKEQGKLAAGTALLLSAQGLWDGLQAAQQAKAGALHRVAAESEAQQRAQADHLHRSHHLSQQRRQVKVS